MQYNIRKHRDWRVIEMEYRELCCEECFEDAEIRKWILANGEQGDCPFCGSKDVMVCDTQTVGEFVKDGLRRAYEQTDFWDESICCLQSIYDIMHDTVCIFSERLEEADLCHELLEELVDPRLSVREIKHGDDTDWDVQDIDAPSWLLIGELSRGEGTQAGSAWDEFKYTSLYFNRFFDITEKRGRETLLSALGDILEQLEVRYRKGRVLYRMRAFELPYWSREYELGKLDVYQELGPAPYTSVKNNRMSPAGISYIYLSSDPETCAKEIRLEDGQTALLGKFSLRRPLTLLDLTVENIKRQNFYFESIFSEDYNPDELWIKDFLLQFAGEISKPVSEENSQLEYVPTQLLAEFIRKRGYDGIVFSSSVSPDGKNYVLFYGPAETPECGTFVGEALEEYSEVLKLKSVSYEHVVLTPHLTTALARSNIPDPKEKTAVLV